MSSRRDKQIASAMRSDAPGASSIDLQPFWFDPTKQDEALASAIQQTLDSIVLDSMGMRWENAICAGFYNNRKPVAFLTPSRIGANYTRYGGRHSTLLDGYGLSLNIIKSCVDTLMSKLGKNRPRVRFVTDNGTDTLQVRARRLQRYVDGVFAQQRVYQSSKKVLMEALVYGTGAFKVFSDDDGIRIEAVRINELYVDFADGNYGTPSQLFQKKLASRLTLQRLYPAKAGELANESNARVDVSSRDTDQLDVTESWLLPTNAGTKDGRHVISTGRVVLLDEVWDRPRFPFVFLRWNSAALSGFFNPGLAKELLPIQARCNEFLGTFSKALRLSIPKLMVDSNTVVSPGEFNDIIGGVVRLNTMAGGMAPQYQTPQMLVAGDAYKFLWDLYSKAYEVSGINQMAAAGTKPSGLDSGAAQREYNDLASERFSSLAMDHEQCFLELAEAVIDESKRFHGKKDKVQLTGGGHTETIPWGDVDMDRDAFHMTMFPASLLPTQPAARLAAIQEYAQAGFIDRETLMALAGMPDVSEEELLVSAPYRAAYHIIDRIVHDGVYTSPNKYMKVDTCLQLALRTWNDMMTWDDADEDTMALLTQFIDECNDLIQTQNGAAQPGQAPVQVTAAGAPVQAGAAPMPAPAPPQ